MFFHIGSKMLENFPVVHHHGNLYINIDDGWTATRDQYNNLLLYKGYLDEYPIQDKLLDIAAQEEPRFLGNFCLIKCFDQGVSIKTDRLRSFPMWYDAKLGITNLQELDWNIWTDSFAMLTHDLQLVESKFDLLGTVESSTLSFDQVVDVIDAILTNKVKQFAKNNTLPLRSFLSGGIDTGLLYSYLVKHQIDNTLIDYSHIDFDYFYLKNHQTLSKFWGYNQIHHWKEPCVLLTGAPGDEFTVRSPTTANMMLRYHGTSITQLLTDSKYQDCLHRSYFLDPEYSELWEQQQQLTFNGLDHAMRECLNLIVNDYQHWHLGNTITWTPLRDMEIFKLIARLGKNDLMDQIMNSSVQKELISRNDSALLACLSTQKNSGNYMENLTNILHS
jgi:hypothetical protein